MSGVNLAFVILAGPFVAMTLTLARGGARSDRHTTRHADQVEPPQAVMVGPTQAVRTIRESLGSIDERVIPCHPPPHGQQKG